MTVSSQFVQKFKRTFLHDDLDGFMELIADDCEWTMMATGEKFSGAGQIRDMAQKSLAARKHVGNARIEPLNLLTADDYLIFEYAHRAVVTGDWPSSHNQPPVGVTVNIPICIVARTTDEMQFDEIREYFDLATASGRQGQKLYS